MAKVKKVFICSNCGFNAPKWEGKCVSCKEWNTLKEETVTKPDIRDKKREVWDTEPKKSNKAVSFKDIQVGNTTRIILKDNEMNRALGGGIVPGSLILIGGQPGIGKSTLLIQLSANISSTVLYVSGEESLEQLKMRADRINALADNCLVLAETNLSKILAEANKINPTVLIIDSIQTLHSSFVESAPGSISQIRECTVELQKFAKERNICIFIIGHINKEGSIAGPKLLEHIVDTVLQFEGDRNYSYRILRTLKNRFGSTDEMAIYEMGTTGLREVNNPSELLITQHETHLSGIAIAATLEGMRPLLIETQALVSTAVYGTAQRTVTGFDTRRLNMLLAVLDKRGGFQFGQNDVFLNLAGGIKVNDPAIDLAIIVSIISSYHDIPVDSNVCFAGEIGLSGEIRAVSRIEQRIQEAEKLGFAKFYLPKYNKKGISKKQREIELVFYASIAELISDLFA